MKNKIIAHLAFFMITVFLFVSCGKTYIEENQDKYSASDVVPVVLGVTGTTLALQTFSYTFEPSYIRAGSTWSWSATDATISSVSADTREATVLFNVLPASDTALISVSETTSGGVTSNALVVKIKVKQFCPLTNGTADLEGSWSGEDAWYDSEITMADGDATSIQVTGFNAGFIFDWWGEEIIEGGTVTMTVNNDGTVVIPKQYLFTTLYDGDPYRYEIDGAGIWDNCGDSPFMSIDYSVYYEGEDECYAAPYSPTYLPNPYFTADITLDDAKSIQIFNKVSLKPSPRK
jgi:hypothetical protein